MFLVDASAALIREHVNTHLAVTATPGIIFTRLVYFFSAFLPFPEEGITPELGGASGIEDEPAGTLGETVERESGSVGVSALVCVSPGPGTWRSVAGGGGDASEEGGGSGVFGVSTARDSVVVSGESAGCGAVMSMGEEGAVDARPTPRCDSSLLRSSVTPEPSVGDVIFSGTRSSTANGVVFEVLNTSAL